MKSNPTPVDQPLRAREPGSRLEREPAGRPSGRPEADAAGADSEARTGWTEIRPTGGLLRGLSVRELWDYRQVVGALASRQLRVRYKQTALGVVWVVLQPIVTVVVFTLVFNRLAGLPSQGIPYPAFTLVGLVLWSYISASVSGATQRLVEDRQLITKIYFPRVLAPLASLVPPLIDLGIGLIVAGALIAMYGISPGWAILLLPVWLLGAAALAFSAGMLFSALNVEYRDVGAVIAFVLQIWLFASPVVYPSSSVHGFARAALAVNPVTGLVDGIRFSLLGVAAPPLIDLLSLASGIVLAVIGLLYFQRVERKFADIL